jgi:hypothetical protein
MPTQGLVHISQDRAVFTYNALNVPVRRSVFSPILIDPLDENPAETFAGLLADEHFNKPAAQAWSFLSRAY